MYKNILMLCLVLSSINLLSQKNSYKIDSILSAFTNPKINPLKDSINTKKEIWTNGVIKSNIDNMPIIQANVNSLEKMPIVSTDKNTKYNMPIANGNTGFTDIKKAPIFLSNPKDTTFYFKYKKP